MMCDMMCECVRERRACVNHHVRDYYYYYPLPDAVGGGPAGGEWRVNALNA